MADLRKEDLDSTKFTTDNLPVCPDVNKDHLLSSEVKVDCLNDVYEVNDRFIALVSHDTLPLSRDTNNVSIKMLLQFKHLRIDDLRYSYKIIY